MNTSHEASFPGYCRTTAIWDEADQWHLLAELAMSELVKTPCEFFTSDAVLLECGNASARKAYRNDVVELRTNLFKAERILIPTEKELNAASSSYSQSRHAGAGIVDQISFAIMKRLGIVEAFTNDAHFCSAGFMTFF